MDEEYSKLINNIDITRIQDDEAAKLIESLLRELNALKLNDVEKQALSDAYYDNGVVHLPDAWFSNGKTKVKLLFRGRTFKPSNIARDRKGQAVHVAFSRVLKQGDVVEKKQQWPLTVHIENKAVVIEIEFEVRPVTPPLKKIRPELSPDEPYFEMRSIHYADRTYRIRNGLITYEE